VYDLKSRVWDLHGVSASFSPPRGPSADPLQVWPCAG